jgi:hypothetical protein
MAARAPPRPPKPVGLVVMSFSVLRNWLGGRWNVTVRSLFSNMGAPGRPATLAPTNCMAILSNRSGQVKESLKSGRGDAAGAMASWARAASVAGLERPAE